MKDQNHEILPQEDPTGYDAAIGFDVVVVSPNR
jgi:hypothetical protein